MLKIILQAKKNVLQINEYEVSYPYSLLSSTETATRTYWTLNSIENENIRGSYHLYYHRKIVFTSAFTNEKENIVKDGTITNLQNCSIQDDANATQFFLFTKKLFLYINERNIFDQQYLQQKQELPHFLFVNIKEAIETVHFTLEYVDNAYVLKNEKITLLLNLYKE